MSDKQQPRLQEYRSWLVKAEQKAQEDFDKTVLSLSGGALGISFAFVKDIVGTMPTKHSWFLLWAWIAWGISITSVLASFYFSQRALRKAIMQVDKEEIYSQVPGGLFSSLTAILNAVGGLLFFAGVVLMIVFVSQNLR